MLLLDVDGVLNPFAAAVCPEGYQEYSFFPGEEPVRLCRDHGHWLARLAGCFELVWSTGWEDQANVLVAPVLNLPTLPVVRFPLVPFEPAEKVPVIKAFAGDRPAAWVDDAHTSEAWDWARSRSVPTLLVTADPSLGLTPNMVEELVNWRASL